MRFNVAAAVAALAGSSMALALPVADAGNDTAEALDFVVNGPLTVTLGPFMTLINTIDSVPDAVVDAGDEAVFAWLNPIGTSAVNAFSAPGALLSTRGADSTSNVDVAAMAATADAVNGLIDTLKCAAAVAAAIASDLLPAAKILKVKKLIEALGGVKKVAKLFLEFSNNRDEAIKEGGQTLLDLVEILLGIDSIKKHCK